eukprot:TRINITY_DN1606_c0_g1_i2.p1 TRINITY_DN1606_c0_g1~~TRINITY_DN1606_c0_g1_i2.p1  ORF type:complete len:742 (+),score=195.89 TRINITY_DN1606_c0_g1_i2:36-2261(+)
MEAMECWDQDNTNSDLSKWVKDRTAKGDKGILSLEGIDGSVMDKVKRGYQGGHKLRKESAKSAAGWDATPNAGIPSYDAQKDKHCKGLVHSTHFKATSKKHIYAVEASKAQKRFGTAFEVPVNEQSLLKKTSTMTSNTLSRKATQVLRLKRQQRDDLDHLPPMTPKKPIDDDISDGYESSPRYKKGAGYDSATLQHIIAPYQEQKKKRKSHPRTAQNNIHINNSRTYNTVNNFNTMKEAAVPHSSPELAELMYRIETLEEERTHLTEQLEAEQAHKAAINERLNKEIQKKVRSTKRAFSKEGKLKQFQTTIAALQAENGKLRDRCKQTEVKADKFTSVEQERRRTASALQQKEHLFRDLQELLLKTEEKLFLYESDGVGPKNKFSNLDKEHLKNRLQQEVKARALLEKKAEHAETELQKCNHELARLKRSCSMGNSTREVREATTKKGARDLVAVLAQCERERDKAICELRDTCASYEVEKSHLTAINAERSRREQQLVKKLEQKDLLLEQWNAEYVKKANHLECETKQSKKEVGASKLAIARMETEMKYVQKEKEKSEAEARDLDSLRSHLNKEMATLEKKNLDLLSCTEHAQSKHESAIQALEEGFRKKQISWERDRSELIQQVTKMGVREQELAAEARMHEDACEHAKAQVKALKECNVHNDGQAKQAEALKEELTSLARKHNALKAKYEKVVSDKALSQKDKIIESLTNKLSSNERQVAALRDTNAELLRRLEALGG